MEHPTSLADLDLNISEFHAEDEEELGIVLDCQCSE